MQVLNMDWYNFPKSLQKRDFCTVQVLPSVGFREVEKPNKKLLLHIKHYN